MKQPKPRRACWVMWVKETPFTAGLVHPSPESEDVHMVELKETEEIVNQAKFELLRYERDLLQEKLEEVEGYWKSAEHCLSAEHENVHDAMQRIREQNAKISELTELLKQKQEALSGLVKMAYELFGPVQLMKDACEKAKWIGMIGKGLEILKEPKGK